MTLLILFFLLSIAFSFLCSILEAVLLSITPSYVQRKVSEGGPTGALLQEYKKDIDRPLSAILTLNTIAHTVGAIGVGAQAGEVFGSHSIELGPLSLSYEAIVASVMTLAILILSEIIPKTIGANSWQKLAPFTVRTLQILLWILSPLVWLSQLITKSLKKDTDKPVLSRADFLAMTQVGGSSGAIDEGEQRIIDNLLNFEKLTVRDIMTPKPVMFMGHADETLRSFFDTHTPIRFSRIPVFGETRDHIEGLLLKDELLAALVHGKDTETLGSIQRPITMVLDNTPLPALFAKLTEERTHMAIATDEFGSVVGLVSQEDLFETLLGMEIVDEFDNVEDLQDLARERWKSRNQ
ncbi:MAG: CNNM domain-containing protein [Bacteroidia bacterium]